MNFASHQTNTRAARLQLPYCHSSPYCRMSYSHSLIFTCYAAFPSANQLQTERLSLCIWLDKEKRLARNFVKARARRREKLRGMTWNKLRNVRQTRHRRACVRTSSFVTTPGLVFGCLVFLSLQNTWLFMVALSSPFGSNSE